MKKLEKLASFQIQNEKLGSILGGGPYKPTNGVDPSYTGAGETVLPSGPGGSCECVGYTSDIDFGNGAIGYNGTYRIDKPC